MVEYKLPEKTVDRIQKTFVRKPYPEKTLDRIYKSRGTHIIQVAKWPKLRGTHII